MRGSCQSCWDNIPTKNGEHLYPNGDRITCSEPIRDVLARLLDETSASALSDEVARARKKFPGNRLLLTALVEEVGELARAYLQREGRDRVRAEALQCACVAMRIYEEGDSTFDDVTDAEAKP